MSDPWTNQTPLSNADFRKLLSTPRPTDAPFYQKSQPQQHHKPKPAKQDGEPKFKKPAPRPKPKGDVAEEDSEQPKYRDRAKERREGLNLDYQSADAELLAHSGAGASAAGAGGSLSALSIADSKFLGGDLEHTHLVKGLDYALLQQERIKLQKQQQEAEAARGGAGGASASRPLGGPRRSDLKFAGPTGAAVFDALFGGAARGGVAAAAAEMFRPRRTAFVFEFGDRSSGGGSSLSAEELASAPDIPTTLRRSKADCPAPGDAFVAAADAAVLDRVSRIMAYLGEQLGGRAGGRLGKKSRKEHSEFIRAILEGGNPTPSTAAGGGAGGGVAVTAQLHGGFVVKQQQQQQRPAAAAAAAAAGGGDDDDDIFGDAGRDYVPALPPKQGGQQQAPPPPPPPDGQAGGGQARYFERTDDMSDLPPPPPAAASRQADDMDIEEGELPSSYGPASGASLDGYPGAPPPATSGAAGAHPHPPPPPAQQPVQQQAGRGGQALGDARYRQAKPSEATLKLISGMAESAYDECFPEFFAGGEAHESDEEEGAPAAGGSAAAKGAKGAAGKEGGVGKAGDEKVVERRRVQKLDGQLQKIKSIFVEKEWAAGNEAAFAKPNKLEVGGTPMRKRPRI